MFEKTCKNRSYLSYLKFANDVTLYVRKAVNKQLSQEFFRCLRWPSARQR